MRGCFRSVFSGLFLLAAIAFSTQHLYMGRSAASTPCPGDCNGDGQVTVDELVLAVSIALGDIPLANCPAADLSGENQITVDELVAAVNAALNGCAPTPTATEQNGATVTPLPPTETPPSPTSSSTPTPTQETAPFWASLAPLPRARQEVGVAELGGRIYVVGGIDGVGRTVATVEFYEPVADAWFEVAPLPAALHHISVAATGGRLYALGGLGPSFAAVSSVFEYDPEGDSWRSRAPLPTARGAGGAAVIGGLIYFAGGFRGGVSVNDFSVYDPAADHWTELIRMPTPRDHLGAAAVGGIFYAVGGRAGSIANVFDVVEAYEPATGLWRTNLAPMPTARGGLAVAALRRRIYAIGGEGNRFDPLGVFRETEAYDVDLNRWEMLPDMLTPRHGMAAAPFGQRIIVPGGATVAGFGASAANEALVP